MHGLDWYVQGFLLNANYSHNQGSDICGLIPINEKRNGQGLALHWKHIVCILTVGQIPDDILTYY